MQNSLPENRGCTLCLADRLVAATGKWACWTTLLLVATGLAGSMLRYGVHDGLIVFKETVVVALVPLAMLASAWTLQLNRHVRVDIFFMRGSANYRRWVDCAGGLLLLGPTCMVLVYLAWNYGASWWGLLKSSPENGGMYALVPCTILLSIGLVLLGLQGLSISLRLAVPWLALDHTQSD